MKSELYKYLLSLNTIYLYLSTYDLKVIVLVIKLEMCKYLSAFCL